MYIRRLLDDEYEDVVKLITQTVHTVCTDDYTKEELDAWAPYNFDIKKFKNNIYACYNLVAFEKGKLVGFVSATVDGYINRLYTHKDYQRRGVASALYYKVEEWAKAYGLRELVLDSSKTAEGFYLKMGFIKSGVSVMEHGDIIFRNSVMKKKLV